MNLELQRKTILDGEKNEYELDVTAAHMIRDNNKCNFV